LTDQIHTDGETSRVLGLLQGAHCGSDDPDVELAQMLPDFEARPDPDTLIRLLERLARHANPN
jgi:hypothetical protein